jgi:uroporphyrinogen-III decarboxylase
MFEGTNIDGYKEVDKAAGMTWERIIKEDIADKICIIGNIDARHTLCLANPTEVKTEVIECLNYGLHTSRGHILHSSHSIHEDVRVENYLALIEAYRDFFGLKRPVELKHM